MRTVIKGVVIFLILMIAVPFWALSEQNPGLRMPVIAGVAAAIYGVWKYDSGGDSEEGEYELDKT